MRILRKTIWLVAVAAALLLADKANGADGLCKQVSAVAAEYQIDERLLLAVLQVESNLQIGAINKQTMDYGIGQINHFTAAKFGFNKKRLTKDLHYSVSSAAFVLKDFEKRYSKKEPGTWMCRYNIGSKSRPEACLNYLNKLEKARKASKCQKEIYNFTI